jgi:SAM-dependent methyltransferase
MRNVEDDHWWFRALRALVVQEASEALKGRTAGRILDVGCGTGGTGVAIQNAGVNGSYFGVDVSAVALAFTQERGTGAVIGGEAERLPFKDACFDLITVLDVLSQRDVDERLAIAELARVLKPGGTLLVNLPAFRLLRGAHDDAVDVVRRYTKRSASEVIRAAGLVVERMTYWNFALSGILAVWRPISRLLARRGPRSDIRRVTPALNVPLVRLLLAEARLRRWVALPWGSSVFLVAKRPPAVHRG